MMGVAMNDPDKALVEGVQSRDLCAVQLLVSRKFHRLARFLDAVMPGRAAESEALAIKVLRTARNMIDSFDGQDILFDTWLHRLALTLWQQEGRGMYVAHIAATPFSAMPEAVRLSLFLSAYQGLEVREIARIMSCTIHMVERRLRAARLMLSLEARRKPSKQAADLTHAA
jgi:hypothetical protein